MYKLIEHPAVGHDRHRASLVDDEAVVYQCFSPWTMGTYRVSVGILKGEIDVRRLLCTYPSTMDKDAHNLQVFFYYLKEALEGILEQKEGWLRTVETHKFPDGSLPLPSDEECERGLSALAMLRTMPDLSNSPGVLYLENIFFMAG